MNGYISSQVFPQHIAEALLAGRKVAPEKREVQCWRGHSVQIALKCAKHPPTFSSKFFCTNQRLAGLLLIVCDKNTKQNCQKNVSESCDLSGLGTE